MDRSVVVASCLVVLLSGCVGTKTVDPVASVTMPIGDPEAAQTLPWGISDCRFVAALVSVERATLAPHLPEGFRSLAPQEIAQPGAPDPGTRGNFGVEILQCGAGTGPNGTYHEPTYGSFFTFVEPPAELRNSSVAFHFVKWDVLMPDPALRLPLQRAGVPAHEGTAEFVAAGVAGAPMPPASESEVHAAMVLGAGGNTFIDGVLRAPYEPPKNFVEFTSTPNGLVRWYADAHFELLVGSGTLQPAPDTFAFTILGGQAQPAVLFGGPATFDNGSIMIPPGPRMDPELAVHDH